MAKPAVVQIVGLAALRRDLNRLGKDTNSPAYAVLTAGARQAADPIAARVRSSLPRRSGRLAADVRVSTTKTGASMRMGRKTVPYAGPVDFGGYPGERDYLPDGRYMFPAAHGLASTARTVYEAAMERVMNMPGVWTNTGTDPGSVHD
jgi:hypothetical protein